MTQEYAAAHGYASAMDKRHAAQRQRDWARRMRPIPTASGGVNVSGWKQLQVLTEQIGGQVQHGGERWVQA